MQHVFTLLLSLLLSSAAFSAPKINGTLNNGPWKSASTWDLGRIPKTGDTIIISAGKIVIVDNPETLGDVFIDVRGTLRFTQGKLTIGGGSNVTVSVGGKITGTSNSEKLRIGATEVYNGTDPDVFGPATASAQTGSSFRFLSLPVKFAQFNVTASAQSVLVQWATSAEESAARFEIERSTNGNNWITIGSLSAKGTTTTYSNYSFTDKTSPVATAYYRVKQIDIDGSAMYTGIKSIKKQAGEQISISAVNGAAVLEFATTVNSSVTVSFVSLAGQVLSQQTIVNPFGQVILKNRNNLRGAVVVVVTSSQNGRVAKQILF